MKLLVPLVVFCFSMSSWAESERSIDFKLDMERLARTAEEINELLGSLKPMETEVCYAMKMIYNDTQLLVRVVEPYVKDPTMANVVDLVNAISEARVSLDQRCSSRSSTLTFLEISTAPGRMIGLGEKLSEASRAK